jgi:formate dehydrogenase (coenzyme F420) beta subunit
MESIRKKAKELLESNAVQLIIGYENGTSNKVRAAFIKDASHVDKLIFDERCVQNLAVYLVKHEVKHYGKIGIVATIPVMRTINMLIAEQQVKPDDIVVLGISEDGKLLDFPDLTVMEEYLQKAKIEISTKDKEAIEKIKKMTRQERFEYWTKALETCFKCYACRAACPLCYCTRCAVECNQPQWIPVQPSKNGNYEWHMLRSMHLAGRCVSCGECGRACPLDIPVHLLTMYMAEESKKMFGVESGLSMKMDSVLSTYKPDDKEQFIQ